MQKVMLSAKILAAATIGLSVLTFASSASATNLVPSKEGEIKTDLGCLSNAFCIDTQNSAQSPVTYSVTSNTFNNSYGKSLLFVDKYGTENKYKIQDSGFKFTFGATDAGTTPTDDQHWFRAVARDKSDNLVENGNLEIGNFLFDFGSKTIDSLTFELFDVETSGTKIVSVNGNTNLSLDVDSSTTNGSRQLITLKNVNKFEIQLGNPNSQIPNGDGVLFRTVPEPTAVISLGALAVAGMFGTRQRRKVGV
jgi:hypothetical protein